MDAKPIHRYYEADCAVPTYRLTINQLNLLRLLMTGDSLKVIAHRTGRTIGTMAGTRTLMLRHMGCTTTLQMVVMAMRAGWVV